MTLVAYTLTKKGKHSLVSDLLLSSDLDQPRGSIELPMLRGISEAFERDRPGKSLVQLVQKMVLINPKLCFAGAGLAFELKELVEDLRIRFSQLSTTPEEIQSFLDNQDFKNFSSSIVLLLLCENQHAYFFKGEWLETREAHGWTCVVTGSGARGYLEYILQERRWGWNYETEGNKNYEPIVEATLCCVVDSMARELMSQKTLLNYWGGGFEVLSINEDGYYKLNNIVYVIVLYEIDSNGADAFRLYCGLYYHYHEDTLIIYDASPNEAKTSIYFVHPIDKRLFDEEAALEYAKGVKLSIDHLAICVIYRGADRKELYMPTYVYREPQDRHVDVGLVNGVLRCSLHEQFKQEIRDWVISRLSAGNK